VSNAAPPIVTPDVPMLAETVVPVVVSVRSVVLPPVLANV
jgi:hypothetical protein